MTIESRIDVNITPLSWPNEQEIKTTENKLTISNELLDSVTHKFGRETGKCCESSAFVDSEPTNNHPFSSDKPKWTTRKEKKNIFTI